MVPAIKDFRCTVQFELREPATFHGVESSFAIRVRAPRRESRAFAISRANQDGHRGSAASLGALYCSTSSPVLQTARSSARTSRIPFLFMVILTINADLPWSGDHLTFLMRDSRIVHQHLIGASGCRMWPSGRRRAQLRGIATRCHRRRERSYNLGSRWRGPPIAGRNDRPPPVAPVAGRCEPATLRD